jgi:hypothetical protein
VPCAGCARYPPKLLGRRAGARARVERRLCCRAPRTLLLTRLGVADADARPLGHVPKSGLKCMGQESLRSGERRQVHKKRREQGGARNTAKRLARDGATVES